MTLKPQDTSAEEPEGGNPHIRFRGGPRQGDRPGLLNNSLMMLLPDGVRQRVCRCTHGCIGPTRHSREMIAR